MFPDFLWQVMLCSARPRYIWFRSHALRVWHLRVWRSKKPYRGMMSFAVLVADCS